MAEIYGYTVIDPLSVMLTHLSETIKKHAYELFEPVRRPIQLVENLKQTSPELVEETDACRCFLMPILEKILRNLLKRRRADQGPGNHYGDGGRRH